MQHSQSHIGLYRALIFLSFCGNMLHIIESLMMMLSSYSIASFSLPSSGDLTMLLCGSMNATLKNKFGTNCGPDVSPIDNSRQSLAIEA